VSDRVLIVKSTGGAGLGDLLRAVLSGIHYAHVSGRAIQVCWDDGLYGPVGVNVFADLFQLTDIGVASISQIHADGFAVHPAAWQGNLAMPLNQLYAKLRDDDWNRSWALDALSFDQSRFDYPQDILVMWDFDQFERSWLAAPSGRRYGLDPASAQVEAAARHLRIVPSLQSAVSSFQQAHFVERMIGVHVRQTNEGGGKSRHVPLQAYFASIDKIRQQEPQAVIFLATDNVAVETQFRQRYPQLVTSQKWLPTRAGDALHFAEGRVDKLQGAREAVIDLYLLAACDYLIHPHNSSFSRVASMLRRRDSSSVFPLHKRNWPLGRLAEFIAYKFRTAKSGLY